MNEPIIADSDFLLACLDREDLWHGRAIEISQDLDSPLVMFDCVFNELYSSIRYRAVQKSEDSDISSIIDQIEASFSVSDVLWSYERVQDHYTGILQLLKIHKGKLDFHDCLIALVARERGIERIVSFNHNLDGIEWLLRLA